LTVSPGTLVGSPASSDAILVVFTSLVCAAEYDVSNLVWRNFGVAPHELGDRVRGEIVGSDGGKRAREAPDRSPDSVYYVSGLHCTEI
jgi:hypothetical protein